jgi:hypothetical protein
MPDVLKLLRFNDVVQFPLVSKRLKFLKQVKFVLFQLFNATVQAVNRVEHLIMLLLVL